MSFPINENPPRKELIKSYFEDIEELALIGRFGPRVHRQWADSTKTFEHHVTQQIIDKVSELQKLLQ